MSCSIIVIREYQGRAIAELRLCIAQGKRRLILQAATGAGKTVMAAEIIKCAVEKGKRVLFLAHARELVKQCSNKLRAFGVDHGIIMRGELPVWSYPVQVASKDTLLARAVRRNKIELPPADLVIADECHRSMSKWWRHLISMYPNAVLVGLTATPARGDGTGLGDLYEAMVQAAPSSQLIREGFLVPTRVFAPYRPNLKGVRITKGDYNRTMLEHKMDKVELVGDVFDHWKQHAEDRQTIVFASGVQHSMHIRDVFLSHGVTTAHVDGETDLEDRDDTLRMFMSGDVQVLTNCDVLTEGVDLPLASCCILARPTRSIVKFRQMAGRVQRPYPGKADALMLDHSGAVYLHGFPDQDMEWTLESGVKIQDIIAKRKQDGKHREPIVCKKCHCAFYGTPTCPNCGTVKPERRGKDVATKDGQLTELKPGGEYQPTREEKQRFWHRCLAIAANKGLKCGAAAHMFKQHFGTWPMRLENMPTREQWKQPARAVFPQYIKGQKAS